MEEILVKDASEKCGVEETPAAVAVALPSIIISNNSANSPAATTTATTTTTTATCATAAASASASGSASAEDPTAATHVMSMLYIQPSNPENSNGQNQQQSQFHVVKPYQKTQIATFSQILQGLSRGLSQGLSQVGQNQIAQPITIRKHINSVNPASAAQTQKHFVVRKSNASGTQIMPLGTAQESQIHTQAAPSIAYLIKPKPQETVVIPQGSIPAAQLSQKLVIAPVISHVTPTSNSTPGNVQNQTPKHMANIILPMSIPQQSVSITKKRLNIEQNLNLKYNNGHINSGSITVLRESKTSNSTSNPPPLHPISTMSLLPVPKSNSNSPDSIKITENPDSAVITPIPKKDDNSSEKRKKTISNILRGSGEKVRVRKQDLQSSLQDTAEMSSYTLNSPELALEKDKKKDKESDDDITLIEVVPSEEKKVMKRPSISDEIIRKLNSQEIEIIEKCEKVNGKQSSEEIKPQTTLYPNDSNYDATKALDWKDGVGSLPGSKLKFCVNEFGLMEVIDQDKNKQDRDGNVGDKENKCLTQSSSKSSSPTIVNEKKSADKKARSVSADTFYCCEGCGCHGLASEFESPNSCSPSCTEYIEVMRQEKLRKEKELNKEMKVKKRRKKLLQEEQANEKNKDISSKANDDEKSKDSGEMLDSFYEKSKPDTDEDTNMSAMDEETQGDSESKYPWQTGKSGFSWSKYIEHTKAKGAPVKLFKDPFPYTKNNFKVGMKLEGIDPNNPSHYCVLTVAEVVGYRLRLHFDGYAENFDFWVNADSMDIFPVGWAEKNGHKLQPPKNYTQENFNWNTYLKLTSQNCKAIAAPKNIFSNRNSMLPTGFRVGMKLEAVDRKHSSLVCVASVADVMDSRILVHFDSWDDVYDYWADISSPYIHPIGWCHHNGRSLTPPNFFKDAKSFSWDAYLKSTGSIAAPSRAFKQRPPCGFKRGMKLEAVDKRLPQLIRVTTVEDVKDHMIKIRFDGWPESHAYWVDDDSTDIHPVGWCSKTGHPLEPPLTQDNLNDRPECGTFGCRGIGHVKGPKFSSHNSASGCPYSPQNINKIKTITDRLNLKHEVNDFDEDGTAEKPKQEKNKTDRFEKRLLSLEEKPIKAENIKQEDCDSSDRNEKMDTSERLSGKWKNNSDGQTDEEEVYRKRKKRKFGHDDSNILPSFTSNHNSSSTATQYATNIPDKQLRLELYHSVYNPGYNPMPDAPHVWAKHSNALNRVVAKQNTNPRRWSSEEVIKFIQSLPNCREIGSVFRKHNLDGDGFLMLTQEDLVSTMGLRLGPAIKLYNSIVLLRKRVT